MLDLTVVRSVVLALALSCALFACSSSSSEEAPPPAPAPPAIACADGFSAEGHDFCVEIAPESACGAGTRPSIGSRECVPVGTRTLGCPTWAKDDPSGWGCADRLPAACAGATREATDSATCVPVGDCNAAFPPAGAIVVDASLADAQVDATHKKKIADAIAAAAAGATIAIERGTYAEDLVVEKSLSIVGRCPAQVTIEQVSGFDPGILVQKAAQKVSLSGFTVKGHYGGIDVFDGASATIEEVVVDGAGAFGIIVDSSTATIKRSKIMNTVVAQGRGGWGISAGASDVSVDDTFVVGGTSAIYAGTKDTSFTVTRLVATGQAPQAPIRAAGAYAYGGRITIDRSVFHDLAGDAAVAAEQPKSIVEVRNTIMRDIKVSGSLARGYGAVAFNGGEVDVRGSTIARAESVGILARDRGSIMNVYDTTVIGANESFAQPDQNLVVSSERAGMGAQAVDGATLTFDDVAIVNAWGFAVVSQGGATLAMKSTVIENTRVLTPKAAPGLPFAVGLTADHGAITVDDVAVTKTTLTGVTIGRSGSLKGKKLYVRDIAPAKPGGQGSGISVGQSGDVQLDASAIVDSTTAGVLATYGPATMHLVRSSIHGTRAGPDGPGPGVVVRDKANAILESTAIWGNASYGVAASGGRGRLVGCVVANHEIAVEVQRGSVLVESDDEGNPDDLELRIASDTVFLDNTTKVGSVEIPFPEDVLPP
jgi:hypothetical protein